MRHARRPPARTDPHPHPQPLAEPADQRPGHAQEQDERDAFSAWLAHVEAGRIPAGATLSEVTAALEEIYSEWLEKGRHVNMGVCVQRYVSPEMSGHVSNELRLSATRKGRLA